MSPRTPGLGRHANRALAERARVRIRRLITVVIAVLFVGTAAAVVTMLASRDHAVSASAELASGVSGAGAPPPADGASGWVTPPAAPPPSGPPPGPAVSPPAPAQGSPPGKPGDPAGGATTRPEPAGAPRRSPAPTRAPNLASAARPTAAPAGGSAPAKPAGKQVPVRLGGYSAYDNSPNGPAEVTNPVLHRTAGGRGTFDDPITVAVPSDSGFAPGTRLYLPSVRRYAVVEDSDPDPSSADDLDLWVDGEGGSDSAVDACLDRLTGPAPAEVDPPPGRPVIPGPIFDGSCQLPAG